MIRVTDPRLIERTNGIVQGMSGSPILQDGKLIGAVTHVFINDPLRGFGVLAEWMVYEAGLGGEDAALPHVGTSGGFRTFPAEAVAGGASLWTVPSASSLPMTTSSFVRYCGRRSTLKTI